MLEYKIIVDDEFIQFVKKVNEHLEAGWICQGGIAVEGVRPEYTYPHEYTSWYHQAMVKEVEE